jgi:hypothetical protein
MGHDFIECPKCHKKFAAQVWIQAFRTIEQAKSHDGATPDFLAFLTPAPGLLKIQLCFNCQSFQPCVEFTEEEQKAMQAYVGEQDSRTKLGAQMATLFGKVAGKKE